MKTANLFLHDDNHYCPITVLSRLVPMQLSKNKNKKHICLRCINAFGSEEKLAEHRELCDNHDLQRHVYPTEGKNWTNFKNYEWMHYVPFVMNAEFECFIEPIDHAEGDPKKSFTVQYQKHKPSGFCYTIKCINENTYKIKTVLYTAKNADEDIGKKFVESLESELAPIYEILKTEIPMNQMTAEEEKNFKNTKNCHACKLPLGSDRVKDHCHLTGKYRGPTHNKCNLKMKVPKFIPVLFHNLERCDSHLFAKSLGYTERDIKCIPKTDEKYISFSKIIPMGEDDEDKLELRFLDSLKFTQSSLDSLASNLGKDQFKTMEVNCDNSGRTNLNC